MRRWVGECDGECEEVSVRRWVGECDGVSVRRWVGECVMG